MSTVSASRFAEPAPVIFAAVPDGPVTCIKEPVACLQDRGAAAVIFAAAPGADIDLINCTSPAECALPLTIPAIMVTHEAGKGLQVWHAGWLCLGRQ